ncbi:MAG: hypothetical protein ACOVSS_09775 [Bacteroidia bacterium]
MGELFEMLILAQTCSTRNFPIVLTGNDHHTEQ